jgi:signal transduction histidine kinase
MAASQTLATYSEVTLEEVARLAIPLVADCCQFHLRDERGNPRRVAVACVGGGCGHCSPSSEPSPQLLQALGSSQVQLGSDESSGSAALVVPLCGLEETLGALTLGWRSPPDTTAVYGAELLGRSVALAVDRARLKRIAEEAVAAREQFLSTTSHALRSPLATLRLQLQVGLRRLQQGEAATAVTLQKSLVQTDRLNLLINDLVDASRIGTGQLALERQPVDIRMLLAEVVEGFRLAHPGRLVDVSAPEGAVIAGDRRRLAQLVGQLLDNAAKFSGETTDIRVSLTTGEGLVALGVADQGIGIAAAEQPQLFDPFFRASNANTLSSQGVGLGLYIGRAIAEGHGGRLWVESELGSGATFRVTLPVREP